jgi:hypothetical protein
MANQKKDLKARMGQIQSTWMTPIAWAWTMTIITKEVMTQPTCAHYFWIPAQHLFMQSLDSPFLLPDQAVVTQNAFLSFHLSQFSNIYTILTCPQFSHLVASVSTAKIEIEQSSRGLKTWSNTLRQ